jgi:transposase
MKVKNQVKLKAKERKLLKQIINKGSEKARKITRARILLLAHEGKTDTHIIESLKVARNTVRTARSRYVKEGLEAAINELPRPGAPKKFTGRQRAKITAMACSKPPEGRSRWTLRLIADRVIE